MKSQGPPGEAPPDPRDTRLLTAMTRAGIQGALLMPAVVIPGIYNTTVFSKMACFQVLVEVTFPAFVVLAWQRRELRPRMTLPLGGLLAWLGVLGLATLFAQDPAHGFWGVSSRMTGLFSLLHLAAWTVMTGSMLRTWPEWLKLLRLQMVVGGAVALVGVLQVAFPAFAMVDPVLDGRVSGLMGNPIFFASYLVFTFFLAAWFLSAGEHRRLATAVMITCALGMLASGSRGPLLGSVVGAVVGLLTAARRQGNRRLVLGTVTALTLSILAYASAALWLAPAPQWADFFRAHPSLAHLLVLGDASRWSMWGVTWEAIKARPWLGWGHENVDVAYAWSYRPLGPCTPASVDRPHSVLLEVLVTGGVLGFVTWAAWWLGMFRAALRSRVEQPASTGPALVGLLTAQLVGSLVAFDTPVTWMMLCLVCALLHFMARPTVDHPVHAPTGPGVAARGLGFASLGVAGAWLALMFSVQPLLGAWVLYQAGNAPLEDRTQVVASYLTAAPLVDPYPDDWLLALSTHATQLLPASSSENGAEQSVRAARMLVDAARPVAARALEGRGTRPQVSAAYGRMLATVGEALGDTTMIHEAGAVLKANVDVNPRRQNSLMDLADWLALTGRVDEGWEMYQRALALDPDNAMTNWRAGYFVSNAFQDKTQSARLLVHAAESPCVFPLTPPQLARLAQARADLGNAPAPP